MSEADLLAKAAEAMKLAETAKGYTADTPPHGIGWSLSLNWNWGWAHCAHSSIRLRVEKYVEAMLPDLIEHAVADMQKEAIELRSSAARALNAEF